MTDQPVIGVILVCPQCRDDFAISAAKAKKPGMKFCKPSCAYAYRKAHPVVTPHIPKYARGRKRQGFASLSPERRAEVSRKGGLAAQAKGTAHRWSKEDGTGKAASAKGAIGRARKRALSLTQPKGGE